jgi:hypothetical protein
MRDNNLKTRDNCIYDRNQQENLPRLFPSEYGKARCDTSSIGAEKEATPPGFRACSEVLIPFSRGTDRKTGDSRGESVSKAYPDQNLLQSVFLHFPP